MCPCPLHLILEFLSQSLAPLLESSHVTYLAGALLASKHDTVETWEAPVVFGFLEAESWKDHHSQLYDRTNAN